VAGGWPLFGGLVPEHTGDGSDGEDPEADGVADTKPGLGNFAAAGTMDTTDAGIEGALPPQPAVVIKQEVGWVLLMPSGI
jgi:hypothetical protein